jgi:deoxyribodipyrimidine photo-lyase
MTTLLWFRQDLRLRDNPALAAAQDDEVLPVYILDDDNAGDWRMGAASRWWLHQSLARLNDQLNGQLAVFKGDPLRIIPELIEKHRLHKVLWNRSYEPWLINRDKKLKNQLQQLGIEAQSFAANLLFEPWEGLKGDGTAYRVFTPYYKNCLRMNVPQPATGRAGKLKLMECGQGLDKIDSLGLLPAIDWYSQFESHWQPGEDGAHQSLKRFLSKGINDYKEGRDFPARQSVSRLSPHLHFGEISPRQMWQAAAQALHDGADEDQVSHFQRELVWREFSHSLLYHFPDTTTDNLNHKFDHFPWRKPGPELKAWQKGETGYPIVDAGMRELWTTGYMHNRVRMIVGSFLVKNLLLHWHEGARWFWDCLLDADLANNTAGWQWVAGSGADAAPYFRIFNPISQSERFDPDGDYIRRFVPELRELDSRHIHNPAQAPALQLQAAGVKLGENYPEPIVELKPSRQRALDAYAQIKGK